MILDSEKQLNSFNSEERFAALDDFAAQNCIFNMHCHSFFSYNGYGFSPTMLAVLAKKQNWRAVGLVDFDVLDGVDEFLCAADKLGVRACAGMETRVFIPELSSFEINSPGEPGVAYHLGYGFTTAKLDAKAQLFATELRHKANNRTKQVLEAVNKYLPEIALNFDAVAQQFTPAGNVTERHLCAAYRVAAETKYSGRELIDFWESKIGSFTEDGVKLEAAIRSKTMKQGGVGYITPTPGSFPLLSEMNAFIQSCGAIPTVAWLNGFSAGEKDPDELLDLHIRNGAKAITIIPDRNWRTNDLEKQKKLTDALDAFIIAANKRKMPILAGTEMNAPGQLLADDFTVPALFKHLPTFIAGADAFTK